MSRTQLALANVVAWATFHAVTGYAVHRLRRLPELPVHPSEMRLWRAARIKRWKDRVPEAGALFAGGVSKRTLGGDIDRFVVETRRAELGHWLAMACGPLAALWNPPAGTAAMVGYGVAANAPFIAIQRYNRARALRVVGRRSRGSARRSPVDPTLRTIGKSIP